MPPAITSSAVAASATQGNSKSSGAKIDLLEPSSPLVTRVLPEETERLLGESGLKGTVESLVVLAEDSYRGSLEVSVCAAKALVLIV